MKELVKKHKKKAKTALKIWRLLGGTLIFLVLTPTFLANHDGDHFFMIVLILTALVAGLLWIFKQPLKKKLRKFIDSGMKLLLIGALLIILSASIHVEVVQSIVLVLSALFYAFALQRLGISYFVGIP